MHHQEIVEEEITQKCMSGVQIFKSRQRKQAVKIQMRDANIK